MTLSDDETDKIIADSLRDCKVCWNCDAPLAWGRIVCSECARMIATGAILVLFAEFVRWVLS